MADHSPDGYDMTRQSRCFYAFLAADGARVKVGMVGRPERLGPRLAEVTRKRGEPGLTMVASATIHDLNEHEAEDTEAALRLWLTSTSGLTHSGLVDWLLVASGLDLDWQQLLERGLAAIKSWRIAR
ncbi:MAG: hypothetical protein ACRDZ0_06545 [Acidimicrobiales bacterium]